MYAAKLTAQEKAWAVNDFTKKLSDWAREHNIRLYVAGDKASGNFVTTLPVESSVKFLVTGKKGLFGAYVKPVRPRARPRGLVPRARPHILKTAAPKNYIYMPDGAFRSARGKIEREWAVLKTWRRFATQPHAQTLAYLYEDALILAYCQNLRIASELEVI